MITEEIIHNKLTAEYSPALLEVINESHQHNVPTGSESHFKVVIVSEFFSGKPLIARHRAINALLAEQLQNGVHALSLHTLTPAEWEAKNGTVKQSPPCLGGDGKNAS